MCGISQLKQGLQIHFAGLYSEAKHKNEDSPPRPGEDDLFNTLWGLFRSLIDAGILRITSIINQMCNEDDAGQPHDDVHRSNTISQAGIHKADAVHYLKNLSIENTKLIQTILGQLEVHKHAILGILFSKTQDEVVLHSFFADNSLNEAQIVVGKGGVYLTHLEEKHKLVSARRYFRLFTHNLDMSLWDLSGQNLSNLTLSHVNLVGANFDQAVLENTTVTLDLPTCWDWNALDVYFNHLDNTKLPLPDVWDRESGLIHKLYLKKPKNCSLLTAIDSINTNDQLKLNLMRQVVASLKNVKIGHVREAMLAIFDRDPVLYNSDREIAAFIAQLERTHRSNVTPW